MPRIDICGRIKQAFYPSNTAVLNAQLKYSNVVKGGRADRTAGMCEAVNDPAKYVTVEYTQSKKGDIPICLYA